MVAWIKQKMSILFCIEGLAVGLMVLWRWLILTFISGSVLFGLSWGILKFSGIEQTGVYALRITNIIMLGVWILILNYIGKQIALKRHQTAIQPFIGWSIFWRELVLRILFVLPVYCILWLIYIVLPYEWLKVTATIIFVGYVLICVIATYGYATRKAFEIYANIPLV